MEVKQLPPPLKRRRVVVPDRAQSCQAEGFYRQQLKRLENCAQRGDGRLTMKSQLITTIAAVLLVGCGPSEADRALFKAVAGVELGDTSVQLGGREHEERNIEAVKQHLAAGADVDVKGGWAGGTPLHYAVGEGRNEIAKLLIAKGANVNAKDGNGSTPLHYANTKEIAEPLIAEGANVNAKNKDGKTPLDLAIQVRNTELADLLRKHGGKTGEELKAEGK